MDISFNIFNYFNVYQAEAKLASSVFARFCGNMAANIGLQYAAEVLPTPVRGQGVALVHIFGILAHAVSPYITDLVSLITHQYKKKENGSKNSPPIIIIDSID